jgi:hypothetical protein
LTDPTPRPIVRIPAYLHPHDVMDCLRRLNVAIPEALSDAECNGQPLWMGNHKFSSPEIDAAISQVTVVDRWPQPDAPPSWDDPPRFPVGPEGSVNGAQRLKNALSDHSILQE